MKQVEKPSEFEYAAFYEDFVKLCAKDLSILNQLQNNCKAFTNFLNALSAEQLSYRYEADKWTIKDILQHMIDVERVFLYRAMCFARGDKLTIPFIDENAYALQAKANKQSLSKLLKEYKATRAATIAFHQNQSAATHKKSGFASNTYTSVRACCWIVAGHELHHWAVIRAQYLPVQAFDVNLFIKK